MIKAGGVNLLFELMQNLEYIDVAENAVRCLEKISYIDADEILNGGLMILLNVIDFFVS